MNADQYSIVVRSVVEEGHAFFEATVREFPDIAVYEADAGAAFEQARNLVESSIEILSRKGTPIPKPVELDVEYSGRVTLRLPKTLHRTVAYASDAEAVSLNQYIVSVLSEHVGYLRAHKATEGKWHVAKKDFRRPHYLRVVDQQPLPIEGAVKWAESK